MTKRYNVYIVHIKTEKADCCIGENMTEERAERRVMTGLSRINSDYFVHDVEVNSTEDKKYQADIKSNLTK